MERGIGKRIWKLLGWLFEKRNNVGKQWAQISRANTCGRREQMAVESAGSVGPACLFALGGCGSLSALDFGLGERAVGNH